MKQRTLDFLACLAGSASQVLGTGTATQIVTVKDTANEDNTRRYKRLRKAIVEGRWWKAEGILKSHKDAATEAISNDGNTMLHIAVGIGKNDFVRKLLNFIEDAKQIEKQNADGCTALPNDTKQQPLPLGLNIGSGVQTGVNLLITAIYTKQYDLASRLVDIYPDLATNDDQVLTAIAKTFPSELDFGEALIYPSLHNFHRKIVNTSSFLFFPFKFLYTRAEDIIGAIEIYRNTCYSWLLPEIFMIILAAVFYLIYQLVLLLLLLLCSPFFVVYFILWKVLAILVGPIKRIEKKKKDYKEAKKILNSVCNQIDKLRFSGSHHPCYRRPILESTCQGAYEVVDEILFRSPNAIDFKNENGLNIIQLAVINRSEKIYNLVYHILEQLQWREEVQKFVFPTYLTKENIFKETPEMVFTREHMHLVKEGEQWMKTTAESCSITAALIITIVFAAAITVPVGSTQETGIPLFLKEVAFTILAVSDAISLFSSTTALLVFLSILTARFSEKDFLLSLPRRLILGLCALFLSTTAMITWSDQHIFRSLESKGTSSVHHLLSSIFHLNKFMVETEAQIQPPFDPFVDIEKDLVGGVGGRDYVHIRIQQRNGRKSLTTIQGLRKELSYEKILKDLKKEFCCNGTIVQDKELGKVIQLQGDQRKNSSTFLTRVGVVKKDQIKIHGF
uniref:Ankyrin repeat-containing protein n=1 Tax=Tanacetum cinerariifolium TaxID=118510 RepID=A0A6L2JDG7_TANCI|nr:ankyrin repeat-containing protein [Tanacetum cinerariifolium]